MASPQTIRLSLAACGLAAALVALVRVRELTPHAGRRASGAPAGDASHTSLPRAAPLAPLQRPPAELGAPSATAKAAPAPGGVIAEPIASAASVAPPGSDLLPPLPAPPSSQLAAPVPHQPRRIPYSPLAVWHQPGLCPVSAEVSALREKMRADFRQIGDGDAAWTLYLDPRLPEGAEQRLLTLLAQAQAVVGKRLGSSPSNPTVFAYADRELMKASACINEEVVAFYDGALHLTLDRPDLLQSLIHEYTHHALFGTGLRAPAWAHEGIAMNVAQETWWREARRLQSLGDAPFSLTDMERSIPYKLPAEQAVAFYVQSALWVQCLLASRGWPLSRLVDTLRAGSGVDATSYDLPELEQHDFLASCVRSALDGSLK